MAEEVEMTPVEMTPVEMTPVAGAEPPKVKPTLKLNPAVRKPAVGAPTAALKPGLKLPPKSGLAAGLKLPPKPGLAAGLKLPPKPGATVAAMRPGLKLPTQNALKPGLKLPTKPVIRKPGETVAAKPIPKPLAVDAQGVGKLPTVSAATVPRGEAAPAAPVAAPKPMEALKSVTQKLKGVTQEIPQQAILHKTGIIADGASDAQKEAAKHKTARISLADAMGVAPVKNDAAPMKTIRIKRPINIPSPTSSLKPQAPAASAVPAATPAPTEAKSESEPATAPTLTQRKTLKITRPGGAVKPAGKFGARRPADAKPVAPAASASAEAAVAEIPDIPDVPTLPTAPVPVVAQANEGAGWVWTLSVIVQFAACVVLGALAWFLYENSQLPTFCGGLGWAS